MVSFLNAFSYERQEYEKQQKMERFIGNIQRGEAAVCWFYSDMVYFFSYRRHRITTWSEQGHLQYINGLILNVTRIH